MQNLNSKPRTRCLGPLHSTTSWRSLFQASLVLESIQRYIGLHEVICCSQYAGAAGLQRTSLALKSGHTERIARSREACCSTSVRAVAATLSAPKAEDKWIERILKAVPGTPAPDAYVCQAFTNSGFFAKAAKLRVRHLTAGCRPCAQSACTAWRRSGCPRPVTRSTASPICLPSWPLLPRCSSSFQSGNKVVGLVCHAPREQLPSP